MAKSPKDKMIQNWLVLEGFTENVRIEGLDGIDSLVIDSYSVFVASIALK